MAKPTPRGWRPWRDPALQATPEQWPDALRGAPTMGPLHRKILELFLSRLELVDSHMQILEKGIGQGLQAHQDAVQRLAGVPGFGVDSATQAIAEVGPTAGTFQGQRIRSHLSQAGGAAGA